MPHSPSVSFSLPRRRQNATIRSLHTLHQKPPEKCIPSSDAYSLTTSMITNYTNGKTRDPPSFPADPPVIVWDGVGWWLFRTWREGTRGGQRVWTAAAFNGCEGVALLGRSQTFPVWGERDMHGQRMKVGFLNSHLVESKMSGECCAHLPHSSMVENCLAAGDLRN